jgi:CDP-diacylglycerol--serine O-phosphatidyltransferase
MASMKMGKHEYHFTGSWLPNSVTLCNLFSGFFSILMITEERFELAAWLIFVSMICDSLDGNIARALKNPNIFGRELDSLADIVSFVVAPSLLAYKSWPPQFAPWTIVVVLIYLSAGAYRLARFNIRPPVRAHFEGFPTPAAAVIVAMTVIAYQKNEWPGIFHAIVDHGILMILLSVMMVSRVPYPKLSGVKFSKWQFLFYVSVLVFAVVFSMINAETAVVSLFLIFLFVSPVYFAYFPVKAAEEDEKYSVV